MGDKSIKTMKNKKSLKRKIREKKADCKLAGKTWLRRLVTCHCGACVKDKWSRYQKKTSKKLKLALLAVMCVGIAVSAYEENWSKESWTFSNETVVVEQPETGLLDTASETKGKTGNPTVVETKTRGNITHSPQVEVKIREAFPEDPDTAVAIAKCESQLDPTRIGDTHMTFPSVGLFQINQTWHKYDTKTLQNADENIRIAKEIKDRWGNWNAWSCYKFGFYQKYLKS